MCKPFQHFIFNTLYNMLYDMFERFAPGFTVISASFSENCVLFIVCVVTLRWLVGLKLMQLEQQKTQLPLIILAKNLKPMLRRIIKGT